MAPIKGFIVSCHLILIQSSGICDAGHRAEHFTDAPSAAQRSVGSLDMWAGLTHPCTSEANAAWCTVDAVCYYKLLLKNELVGYVVGKQKNKEKVTFMTEMGVSQSSYSSSQQHPCTAYLPPLLGRHREGAPTRSLCHPHPHPQPARIMAAGTHWASGSEPTTFP